MRRAGRVVATRLWASGTARRRILVIGDRGLAAPIDGVTAPSEDLASALVARCRAEGVTGVVIDVLSDLRSVGRAIQSSPDAWRLWRYDAVVLVGDAAVTRYQGQRFLPAFAQVLGDLAVDIRVVVVLAETPSPGAALPTSVHELRIADRVVPIVTAAQRGRARLGDADGVAGTVLAILGDPPPEAPPPRRRPAGPEEETGREGAVERSLRALGGLTTDLERVVLLARNSFDVPYAQINLVSDGMLHSLAFAGRSSDLLTNTMSALVVRIGEALLVPDTHADPRFETIDETRGPDAVRFYGGHPIASHDGYRIGALCVFDTVPHAVEADDEVLLRDVALLAEAEINALVPD